MRQCVNFQTFEFGTNVGCFFRQLSLSGLFLLLLITIPNFGMASEKRELTIVGIVEKIRLGSDGPILKAKIDTGAKSSSIDVIDYEIIGAGKKRKVKFTIRTTRKKCITAILTSRTEQLGL